LPVSANVDAGFFALGELANSARDTAARGWVSGVGPQEPQGIVMLGRHVYRVHPIDEGWIMMKEGEDHPRGEFPGREEAIAEAVRLAGSDEPAKVTVDSGDGTIAEEWLFGSDASTELGA
jgi:hypothetical protein